MKKPPPEPKVLGSWERALFAAQRLPMPTPEYVFAAPRKFRADYAWPEQKILLEVDGGVWTGGRHTRGGGFLSDHEKGNLAAMLGWRVFKTTPSDFNKGRGDVWEMLRTVLVPEPAPATP